MYLTLPLKLSRFSRFVMISQCRSSGIPAISESVAMNAGLDPGEEGAAGAEPVPQSSNHSSGHEEDDRGPKFNPPLYTQRYALVQEVLIEHNVESVVDFGCAECKIVHYLKNVDTLRRVSLVDANRSVLGSCHAAVQPTHFEYLVRRPSPLTVSVFCGSAGDLDGRLAGYQAASLVELIEHLEPGVLQQVTHNVFGRLRPSVVIVTTPNADFNVVFPGFTGFRHWDHKFEWTRTEFRQWGVDVCRQHGYTVHYTGVGDPPADMTRVGFCSQAAIFTKVSEEPGEETEEAVYELVEHVEYPYEKRTPEERLENEVDYFIISSCALEMYRSEDDTQAVIPVSLVTDCVLDVLNSGHGEKSTNQDVLAYLRRRYTLADNESNVVVQLAEDDDSSDDFSEDFSQDTSDRAEDLIPQLMDFTVDDKEEWG